MRLTFFLERVRGEIFLVDVYYAVDVERNLLGVGAPVLVSEAVDIPSVHLRREREIAVRNGLFESLVLACRGRDLYQVRS